MFNAKYTTLAVVCSFLSVLASPMNGEYAEAS